MLFRSIVVALSGIQWTNAQTSGTCGGGTCGIPQPTCGTTVPVPMIQTPVVQPMMQTPVIQTVPGCGTCGAPPSCGQKKCETPEPRPDIKIPDPIKGEVFDIVRVETKQMDVIIEKVTIKPEKRMVPCLTKWAKYGLDGKCPTGTHWDHATKYCVDDVFGAQQHNEVVKKVDWEVQLVKHEVEFVVPNRVTKNVEWSAARPYYSKDIVINVKPAITNAKTKIIVTSAPPAPDPPVPPKPASQCTNGPSASQCTNGPQAVIQQPVISQPVIPAQPVLPTQAVVQQPYLAPQPVVQPMMQAPVIQGGYVPVSGAVGGTVIQGGGTGTCGP